MFNQIKSKISSYILKKRVSKLKRFSTLVTLSEAKKISILFDAHTEQSVTDVKTFLKHLLKKDLDIDVLGFIVNKGKENKYISTLHVNYFSVTDVNMFGVPNSSKIDLFLKNKYDILINLSLDNSFETRYLSLMSNSKYRIGVYADDYDLSYDLMFKLKIKSLGYFIEQLTHYLELMNYNNEK